MGFLSRLFGKHNPAPAQPQTQAKTLAAVPTVKASPEHDQAYSIVFYEVMGTVEPFSRSNLDAMHAIINKGGGSFADMGRWAKPIFERYFSDKDCRWPELEEWNSVFSASGRAPIFQTGDPRSMSVQKMCALLKATDIKEALKALSVPFAAKDTKEALIGRLESVTPDQFAAACPAWAGTAEKQLAKYRLEFYHLLIKTISGRAMSLSSRMRLANGKWKFSTSKSEDRLFVDMALKKNPNALPPFFPGDWTIQMPNVAAFAGKEASLAEVEAAAERIRQEDAATKK